MKTFLLLLTLSLQTAIFAAEPAPRTSLSQPRGSWTSSDAAYAILKRADIEMTIVTNQAVDDPQLPGHRKGYSGVAKLLHPKRPSNLFVPNYAGLNYEHIHDGTTQDREVLFEPRHAAMQLRIVNDYCVDLYQPPTPHYQLESCLRYELLADGTLQMTLECIAHQDRFTNGYIGLFWASYIHQPESLDIYFPGWKDIDTKKVPALPPITMVRGITPSHGQLATHRSIHDKRQLKHDDDFPLSLVFGHSKHRYSEPWYYGISHSMGFAQIFRDTDNVRLTQSPSGGGQGNPAWDFQFIIPDYKVGQRYQMIMRAVYQPVEPQTAFLKTVKKHYRQLQQIP